ncbi:hypothetical protein EJ05DRAFT_326426 [Pseudovirgaria hyperparasitica]|uniref:Myosin tail domain-containing protein n=1 Tax=Pseudovirgaria hyperparasitica TaxID=470096 RepID=A0A6A6W9T5_9PEZI|nr:uncharacterized protein EJ05DRAFT_326426 [Pseudovirgaria hyperparasitica]KAF2758919.1 hypothetical protein EJ05DRAFT_326426 [Pseudovirgaria hyperparasitica]
MERSAGLKEQLDAKDRQIRQLEEECMRLSDDVERLKVAAADAIRSQHDQNRQRLERELVTVKGRLAASENDNKTLLNKIQQKNLDIARSNSRMGDSQRTQAAKAQLQAQKDKLEKENLYLQSQLQEAQINITSLDKQKEKLSLALEDLNHEITREHKTSRNAEKVSSSVNLQLADANRKLETERQLRNQAQSSTRAVQMALDNANRELSDSHGQLMTLRKVFDPEADLSITYEAAKPDISNVVELARQLEAAQQSLRVATERATRAETQLDGARDRFEGEISEIEGRHTNSRRALLEEMNASQVNQASSRRSPEHQRKDSDNRRPFSATTTPLHQRHQSSATNHSGRSDRTVDSTIFNQRMDMATQLEEVENRLQMSEMRNRHLENELKRSPVKQTWGEESPSLRRQKKLEVENSRLHNLLDDSSAQISALERSIRSGQLSFQEIQTKSHEELYDLIQSQEENRQMLSHSCANARSELADAKATFDELKKAKQTADLELRDTLSNLESLRSEREQESASHSQLLEEFSDLQIRLDSETSKLIDVESSLNLYKSRADEYFNKLEQAEISVLKATRAEQFAKGQAREAEETCANIMAERKQMDDIIEDLQRQAQKSEERLEDVSADLEGALQSKKRLQNELEDYRSQRAIDIEDNETSMEHTRKTYQHELSSLTHELELERENVIYVREENGRLRDEIEELRGKWDDEVLNSSTWAKEKARLEMTLQDVSNSRDEATSAHNEAQTKIVSLLTQVNHLRNSMDNALAERDNVITEKKTLERRLADASQRLDELSKSESPSLRNAAAFDKELLGLKSDLAQQEDIVAAAVGKMRRSEALAQELQKDIGTERDLNVQLHKEKAALEKSMKDLQLKLVDLETRGQGGRASQDVRFLHGRIQELEKQLESVESVRATESKSVRNVDRTVKDLQTQLERREKANATLADDVAKARDKISNLLKTIDELQSADSTSQLMAKRAERELKEEREKSARIERELEGWKGLRVERRSALGVPGSDGGSRRVSNASALPGLSGSSDRPSSSAGGPGSIMAGSIRRELRKISGSKGFL